MVRVAHTRSGKPIPFLLALFPVLFYFALIGLGYYVYVVTLCVRLIRDGRTALGVVLMVIYHITFFLMLWAYAMVILTDPGRVTTEDQPVPQQQQQQQHQQQQQQPGNEGIQSQPQQSHSLVQQAHQQQALEQPVVPHIQEVQQAHAKGESVTSLGSTGVLIPGARGYVNISEDPSAQSHPLWCNKCHHVKPERAHHCRVCRRCVLKMDHHCPWVLNCVGQDNYKFFVQFIFYTAVHCIFILVSTIPLYLRFSADSWAHQMQIVGMVVSGIFGITLVVFTITHIRLIFLNRTTIEDHNTPQTEGMLPCLRKGWAESEGENNQGNERLYDMGIKQNWEQAMGKGWKCIIPVRFPRPEGPIYNQKVVTKQWKEYNQQMELRKQQLQQHLNPSPGVPQQQQ